MRIDHIGSTAVPGLAAKPIIDAQASVAALEPVVPFACLRHLHRPPIGALLGRDRSPGISFDRVS